MILEDVLRDLREVESGKQLMHRPLAEQAADTIEMLVEKNRVLEEKLAQETERSNREISATEAHIRLLEETIEER